jgi:hypothetical protein
LKNTSTKDNKYVVNQNLEHVDDKLARFFNFTFRYIDDVLSLNNSRFGDFVDHIYLIELVGPTSSRISYKLRDIYTPYAGAAGMLLHMNGKFTMGKLKSSLTIF